MKNWWKIGLVLVLAAVAAYVFVEKDTPGTIRETYSNFVIEDTASVDQIFISNSFGGKVLLSRRNHDFWTVNNGRRARLDGVDLILATLKQIEIYAPVSEQTFDAVVKRLATKSTKVEIYQGGEKPTKTYYFGEATPNKLGTYTLLELDGKKSDRPFITHVPLERGFLSSRFFTDTVLWRDHSIFRYRTEDIKAIEVYHSSDTTTSYRLEHLEKDQFLLTNLETQEQSYPFAGIAYPFFNSYQRMYYEYIDAKTPASIMDSIFASPYKNQVKIFDVNGGINIFTTFYLPVDEGAVVDGITLDYHPDRVYLKAEGQAENYVAQNLTVDALVPVYEYFQPSTTVEK